MVDPTRTLPVLKFIMHTTLFRVAVFPGFMFARIFAAVTIFVERKFLAKMQLPSRAPIRRQDRGNPTINSGWFEAHFQGDNNSLRRRQANFLVCTYCFCCRLLGRNFINTSCARVGRFEYRRGPFGCICHSRLLPVDCSALFLG